MSLSAIMVGGFHWVNLANTIFMKNGAVTDYLEKDAELREWLIASGLLQAHQSLDVASGAKSKILALRDIFKEILQGITENREISRHQIDNLNEIGNRLSLHLHLEAKDGRVIKKIKGDYEVESILFEIMASFAETIEHIALDRIRCCQHDECILHFVDVSKGGKRRWCSMESCGNRVKASNFYYRRMEK